jgi:hypothetical protein
MAGFGPPFFIKSIRELIGPMSPMGPSLFDLDQICNLFVQEK